MQTTRRWPITLFAFMCLVMTSGCQSTERSEQPQWMQTPIADVADVAGKWDGLMRRIPPDGRYEFSSLRTIGVFTGHGEFAVNEGRLLSKSERGTVEAVLYQAGNQRMLKAKGRAADGTEYTAEVKPAK
jgi:hypothetical protein